MKMVASSKLHHAQVMIENMLPYESMLEHILKTFLASEADARTILSEEREVKHVGIVVFSSNSSLCGGFNANVIKLLQKTVSQYEHLGQERITVWPIGRKVAEKTVKLGLNVAGEYSSLCDHPSAAQCIDVAADIINRFIAGDVDRVVLIYHHFKSAGSQILNCKQFLPIDISEVDFAAEKGRDLTSAIATKESQKYARQHQREREMTQEETKPLNDNFIVEPDMDTVLGKLIPQYLNLQVYTALLDSNASEHAARMVAMQTATDNADELLRGLNLQYNKSRQQAITNELLDLAGGQQA